MKSFNYLRSKSDSFISLLKQKQAEREAKKQELLKMPCNFCEVCQDISFQTNKMKKCNGCSKRIVCNHCHSLNERLCKLCDDDLMNYYDKIEKAITNNAPLKYNFGSDDEIIENNVDQLL